MRPYKAHTADDRRSRLTPPRGPRRAGMRRYQDVTTSYGARALRSARLIGAIKDVICVRATPILCGAGFPWQHRTPSQAGSVHGCPPRCALKRPPAPAPFPYPRPLYFYISLPRFTLYGFDCDGMACESSCLVCTHARWDVLCEQKGCLVFCVTMGGDGFWKLKH